MAGHREVHVVCLAARFLISWFMNGCVTDMRTGGRKERTVLAVFFWFLPTPEREEKLL
jgi:hypothetical protein